VSKKFFAPCARQKPKEVIVEQCILKRENLQKNVWETAKLVLGASKKFVKKGYNKNNIYK
jgi:hypothetical protein